jgi:hypothetical protein
MIPTIMPTGFGRDPPPKGDITLDITLMTCQNNNPRLRTWADAINYLISDHQGLSLHNNMTPLEFCNAYVPNNERPTWILNTVPNVFTKFKSMEPESDDYKATVHKFDTAGNTIFDNFKHTDPDARAAYSKPS